MAEWRLSFPITSLDNRVNMRAAVARLQADPFHVRTILEERQDRQWIYRVEFEGAPENPEVLRLLGSHEYELPILTDPPYARTPNLFDSPLPDLVNRNGDVLPLDVQLRTLQEYLASDPPRRVAPRNPLVPPLRARRDYYSGGRRVFLLEALPDVIAESLPSGDLPIHDPDPPTPLGEITYAPQDAPLTARLFSRLGFGTPAPAPPEPASVSQRSPRPQPYETAWVTPGVWVRGKGDPELVACVVHIADDKQVTIRNWRRQPEEMELPLRDLVRYWEECPRPKEPTVRFDRMLDNDFLEDLAPKTATVSIDGKPSFILRWAQTVKKFAIHTLRGDTRTEGPKTRFERLDDD